MTLTSFVTPSNSQPEELLNLSILTSPAGVWHWDIATGILTWSESSEELFGLDPNLFSGHFEDYLNIIHPEDRCRMEAALREAIVAKEPYAIEHRVIWPNGEIRWLTAKGKAFFDSEGRLARIAGTTVDISDRKREEENLSKKAQELERFASIVAHDLKSPLNTIYQFTEFLAEKHQRSMDPEDRQYVEFILKAGKRMRRFIDNLLMYARAGEMPSRTWSPVSIEDLVHEVEKNILSSIQASNAEIEILHPLPVLDGNETQLMQLLQNLFANAIKYRHPDRSLKITFSAVEKENHWLFIVADNGIGIEKQDLTKIFDFFFRIQNYKCTDGSGLGLAICQKIVHGHNGTIWAESIPGQGSQFFFTLMKTRRSLTPHYLTTH